MIGKFICMWLFYVTGQRNGTPTFKFFSSPYPFPDSQIDTIEGSEPRGIGVSQRSILKNRGRNRGQYTSISHSLGVYLGYLFRDRG